MEADLLHMPRTVAAGAAAPQRDRDARPVVMQLVLSLFPGGSERLTVEIVRRLAPSFRMVVCCLDEPGDWAADLDVPVTALGRRPGFHPSLGWRIASWARRMDVSVVHAHHYTPFVYGALAGLVAPRLRLVYTEHGRLSDEPPRVKRRLANSLLSRLPDRAFAVSADLRGHMMAEGFRGCPVEVLLNGVDVGTAPGRTERDAARRALGFDDRAFLVASVARLDPVKHLTAAVEALSIVRTTVPHARLVLVGDGPERQAIDAAAERFGVRDAVFVTGYRADVHQLLPAFDVYVNSSVSEGISLTILEAMAAALPVVATNVGGTPEVVAPGVTGDLVPARAPADLAAAVVRLAADAGLRRQMGAAGRARVEREFTIDRMVGDYARVYAGLGHA